MIVFFSILMSGTLVLFAGFGLCAVLLAFVPWSFALIGLGAVGIASLCLTAAFYVASWSPFKPAADRISDEKRSTL